MNYYVYYVEHTDSGQKYIGAKYGKDADPALFWTTYFTSSSSVKFLVERDGPGSFRTSIRRCFECRDACLRYETQLLKRLKAAQRSDFLNKHNNDNSNVKWDSKKRREASKKKRFWITNGVQDKKASSLDDLVEGWRQGRTGGKRFGKRSSEFCTKMSAIKKGVPLSTKQRESLKGLVRGMSGKNHSEESKKKISLARQGMVFSEEHRANLSKARRRPKNN